MTNVIIAIDAMGGDHGVRVTVPAALEIIKRYPNLHLILVGDTPVIKAELDSKTFKTDQISIHHSTQHVAMDESPIKALRFKKDSSMRVAINLVKNGKVQAMVSAGNTGALMATAKFVLKTIKGVDRPAIITTLPTLIENRVVRILDFGANVDCTAEHLYQFGVMGSVLALAVSGLSSPKVGLLNVGVEEIKGNEQVKKAAQLLSANKNINYIGYVEGNEIFTGKIDVVVCDGFTGNIVLKSLEGFSRLMGFHIKKVFTKNLYGKISTLFFHPILRNLKKQLDPRDYNGASLIGLQGIVIKSHGGADQKAFANAIKEAVLEVEQNVPQRIGEKVSQLLEET